MSKKSKKKLNLSDLRKQGSEQRCLTVSNEVNQHTSKMADKKVNSACPCLTNCDAEDKDLRILNSPFDAYKLNTANDGLHSSLSSGRDSNWEVGEGTPTSLPVLSDWQPAFVYNSSAWATSPFGNANWISNYVDGSHDGDRDYYFRTKFILGDSINPAVFALHMDFFADNAVHEIYVNGVAQSTYGSVLPQSTNPYNHRGFDKGTQVAIQLENDWKGCENEIIVHVKSGNPLIGFLAQNSFACLEAEISDLSPIIDLKWGDSQCDCIETDDYETFYISIRNPFHNVQFSNFRIGAIQVTDENGNPVATLPDGSDSVELTPIGPYCFGDIAPCNSKQDNAIYRQFVLFNRGAKPGKYKILLDGICFDVCHTYSQSQCFSINLCLS